MRLRFGILIAAFVLIAACSPKHTFSELEFAVRQIKSGVVSYGYRVYSPGNRQPDQKLPVMLYMHGSNRRGDDNESQLLDIGDAITENPQYFNFIIVFPQCREGKFWAGEMNQQALAALDSTVKEFDGDVNRLYLAGFSMGGNGTWQNGLVHAGKFAALVPIAGQVAPGTKLSEDVLATLPPRLREAAIADDPYRSFAEGIGQTPVWVFHGSNDESVAESRRVVNAFITNGNANVKYTEYENAGHGIVGRVFREPELIQWLMAQHLDNTK